MIVCPRCGSSAKPDALHCGVCGATLGTAPKDETAAPPKKESVRPKQDSASSMKRTMMGMAPNMSAPAPQATANKLKGTMIGMPAAGPGGVFPPGTGAPRGAPVGAAPVAGAGVPAAPMSTRQPVSIPTAPMSARGGAGQPAGKQTMIGVAAPMIAPGTPLGAPMPGASAPGDPNAIGNRPAVEHKKTMMGVAMPGIAPLAPGVAKDPLPIAEPMPAVPPFAPGAPDQGMPPQGMPMPAGYQPAAEMRRPSSRPPVKPRGQYSAAIALGSGLVLAAGAAMFAFFWRGPAPLRAEARVDVTGTDLLRLTCATCPDGTELRIGETKTKIASQVADLALAAPLGVGENVFTVDVDRPTNGRDEKVSLVVKIGYRIRPDLSGLDSDRPTLRILVDGAPLAKMVIDGKPLDLGPDGKGKYDIDIAADCTGPSDDVKTIERSVPYSVTNSAGTAEQGTVGLRVAVTPLHLDAPSAQAVVESDHFLLGGRTGKGAKLLAGTEPIAVGADGGFSKAIPAPALGDNVVAVRTFVPGQAPRVASLRVKRVERLADEARAFAATAPLGFADLSADVAKHVGERVVLAGDIVETRQQGAKNVTLLDVVKGCPRPPCAARVILPAEGGLARGDRLQVFGRVTRAISAKGEAAGSVPEVESDFFLKKR